MRKEYIDFELIGEDSRIYAQFTKYIKTVLERARGDYLDKELRYKKTIVLGDAPLEEWYDVENPESIDEIERIFNWEMIKSHLQRLTLKEAEVIVSVFINRQTQAECAAHMGVSQPYVASLYKKALQRLQKSMREEEEYGGF